MVVWWRRKYVDCVVVLAEASVFPSPFPVAVINGIQPQAAHTDNTRRSSSLSYSSHPSTNHSSISRKSFVVVVGCSLFSILYSLLVDT